MRADAKVGSSVVTYRSVVGAGSRGALRVTKGIMWTALVLGAALAVAGAVGIAGDEDYRLVAMAALGTGALLAFFSALFLSWMRRSEKDYALVLHRTK